MNKQEIYTDNAPEPIGPYSQAIEVNNLVFVSGQIALDPKTNKINNNSIEEEITTVFNNLKNICIQAGCSLQNIAKVNLYLTDLQNFNIVNEIMAEYFEAPYPARAAVEVSALPKGVNFEAEAILVKDQ